MNAAHGISAVMAITGVSDQRSAPHSCPTQRPTALCPRTQGRQWGRKLAQDQAGMIHIHLSFQFLTGSAPRLASDRSGRYRLPDRNLEMWLQLV